MKNRPHIVLGRLALLFGIALTGTAGAAPITGGSGLDAGGACDSTSVSCPASWDFGVTPAIATGDITSIFQGGTSYLTDIDVDVASLTMDDLGGTIDGVDRIVFTSLTFDVEDWSTLSFDGGDTINTFVPAAGTVTGFYSQQVWDPGNSTYVTAGTTTTTFFSQSVAFTAFNCDVDNQCGFEVGKLKASPGFPELVLPVGVTGGGTPYDFEWTFNVIVPEPSTAALLSLGLLGLAAAGRRRA